MTVASHTVFFFLFNSIIQYSLSSIEYAVHYYSISNQGSISFSCFSFVLLLVSFRYYIFWTLHKIAESRVFENGCILVGFGRPARTMGAEGEQECGRAVLFNAACCSLRPAVCRGITLLRLTSSLFLCPPLSRKRRRRVNPRSSIAEELLCLEKGENTS